MTSPAMDQTHPAYVDDCDACKTLGGPCRSHLGLWEDAPDSLVSQEPHSTPPGWAPSEDAVPDCGKSGCTNPTLHSHKASDKVHPLAPLPADVPTVAEAPAPSNNGAEADDPKSADLYPGQWVQVWAVVTDRQTHPEDVVVRIWEHNADPLVTVARDYVTPAALPPSWARQCTATRHDQSLSAYIRCDRYEGEGHQHRDARIGDWPVGVRIHHMEDE